MIDISTEQLLTLPQAARVRPHGRLGRPTHPSTVYRWISRGARGVAGVVKLEGVRLGGSWYTSREALQRFAEALTNGSTETVRGDTPRQRAADVDEELRCLGL
jgi:hypothetical protein